MENLAKLAYNAWRANGGLATALAPEFEALPRSTQDQWDAVANAVANALFDDSEASYG